MKITEYVQGWVASSKIMLAGAISLLWWLAGRGPILGFKFHRRFWLPLIIVIGCWVFDYVQNKKPFWWRRSLVYAIMLPAYYIMMSLCSYGAGSWIRAFFDSFLPLSVAIILQRIVVGVCWSAPALPVAWINKRWTIYGLHIILFTLTMTILGGFNQLVAAAEEAVIGLIFGLMVFFMIKWEGK